jgi:hypothetical protein
LVGLTLIYLYVNETNDRHKISSPSGEYEI